MTIIFNWYVAFWVKSKVKPPKFIPKTDNIIQFEIGGGSSVFIKHYYINQLIYRLNGN